MRGVAHFRGEGGPEPKGPRSTSAHLKYCNADMSINAGMHAASQAENSCTETLHILRCLAGHHDKQTLIATSIAELLYPEAEHRTDGMPYTDYAELARRCFQKEYTTVLRKAAPVTEVSIYHFLCFSAKEAWHAILVLLACDRGDTADSCNV